PILALDVARVELRHTIAQRDKAPLHLPQVGKLLLSHPPTGHAMLLVPGTHGPENDSLPRHPEPKPTPPSYKLPRLSFKGKVGNWKVGTPRPVPHKQKLGVWSKLFSMEGRRERKASTLLTLAQLPLHAERHAAPTIAHPPIEAVRLRISTGESEMLVVTLDRSPVYSTARLRKKYQHMSRDIQGHLKWQWWGLQRGMHHLFAPGAAILNLLPTIPVLDISVGTVDASLATEGEGEGERSGGTLSVLERVECPSFRLTRGYKGEHGALKAHLALSGSIQVAAQQPASLRNHLRQVTRPLTPFAALLSSLMCRARFLIRSNLIRALSQTH
ncbi:MAG: hypothetical protein SGPRY_013337, partial [Prymnesium sp.]